MNDLDRDFAQFARTGDAAALGRAYDASAAELLAIATRLVGDPVEAEDLVQATFVAAIESVATFAKGHRVMPWLVGILNNRARRFRRARQRVATPAGSASTVDERTATGLAPIDALESKEIDAAVARAIGGLPAVLHPVVVLHLRHGMQPAEIAYALARPPATVRSQLARGLADLRRRLPRQLVLPAALLVSTERGLTAVRTAVLEHGRLHATTLATTTASTTTIAGVMGMLMAKQLQLVALAAVFLAMGAGLYWLPRSSAPPTGATTEPRDHTTPLANGPTDAASAPSPATDIDGTERQTVQDASTPALRVTVRIGQQPLAGVLVSLSPHGDGAALDGPLRLATGIDGVAVYDTVPWSSGIAFVDNANCTVDWSLTAGATTSIELEVPPPGWVRGRVVVPAGTNVRDAIVWVGDVPQAAGGMHDVLHPRADGTFDLPVWNWQLVGARAAGTLPTHHEVQLALGESLELVLQLRAGGAALRGTVVRGEPPVPVAGATIEVGDRTGTFTGRLLPDGNRETTLPMLAVSDADGQFAIDGVPPGSTTVRARARGTAASSVPVELRALAETTVTVTLSAGARVHGRITRVDGTPATGAIVRTVADTAVHPCRTRTDREGRYELLHLPVGIVRLEALESGWGEARASLDLAPAADVEWSPGIDQHWREIVGTLRDAHGAPLPGWWVVANADPNFDSGLPTRVATDGSFRFERLLDAPETYELRVHPPCEPTAGARPAPSLPAVLSVPGVQFGSRDVSLVVADAAMPSAWVRGRIPPGTSSRLPFFLAGESGSRRHLTQQRNGAFECGPLTSGRWRIVQNTFPRAVEITNFELHAGEALDLGVLTVPEVVYGRIDLVLAPTPVNPEFASEFDGTAGVQILLADDLQFVRWASLHGEHTNIELIAGRYLLRLCGAPLWAPAQTCDVVAGERTTVTFTPKAAPLTRIAFHHPGSEHPLEPLLLQVHDANGALQWSASLVPQQRWWFTELSLPAGPYRVQAKTAAGLHADVPLRVEGVALGGWPVVFDLSP